MLGILLESGVPFRWLSGIKLAAGFWCLQMLVTGPSWQTMLLSVDPDVYG